MLLAEALAWLRPRPGGVYVDATVGAGGHARAVLEASAPDGRLVGLDLDADALRLAAEQLRPYGDRVRLWQGSFRDLPAALAAAGIHPVPSRSLFSTPPRVARCAPSTRAEALAAPRRSRSLRALDPGGGPGLSQNGVVDGVLFDLGVSSMQLDRPERGFAFGAEGPLDMRLDPSAGEPAATLVNRLPERELAELLFTYGEEPAARRIARAIVRRRAATPFRTTTDLARVVAGAAHPRGGWRRIHPATRTFQALRIAVNDELGALAAALPAAAAALKPGGRLVVIAFHSLEDRIVKRFIRERPDVRALTRKPVTSGDAELAANPRSRSAKLRAAEKLDPGGASYTA